MARPRTYTLNQDYFKKVDTLNKAYIVGFIFADGSVFKNYLTITVSNKDIEVLNFIKKEMNYSGPLHDKGEYSSLSISSKEIAGDLKSIGIIPNKTYDTKTLPTISDALYPAFLLGFFDGDGSIYKASKTKTYEYCLNFSNNLEVLLELKSYLSTMDVSASSVRRRWDNDISCMMDIKGSLNIEKMFSILYDNPPEFYFSRKRERFDDCMESIKHLTRRRVSDELIQSTMDLFKSGKKRKEIVKLLDLNYSTIRGIIQRSKVG